MKALARLKELEPVIGVSGLFRCTPDWRWEPGWTRAFVDYDLWYICSGIGRMNTSDGPVDLYPGRGVWMRPGRRYDVTHDPASPLHVVAVHFLFCGKKRMLRPDEFVPPVEIFDASGMEFYGMALARVVQLNSRDKTKAAAATLLKSLLIEIISLGPAVTGSALGRHHRSTIAPVVAMIRESPERRLTIAGLAAHTGYTPDHFVRVFRSVTGDSPKEFMIRQRMDRALALLRESSHTVTQIAAELGYEDLGFFSRQFKARIGVSPDRFRRRG